MPDAPAIPKKSTGKKLTTQQKWLLGGGIAAGGIVGVIFLRRASSSSSNANNASASGTADSSDIDPATGYPYGSAADDEALEAEYGAYGTTEGELGEYDPLTGTYVGEEATTAISTNAEWTQYALSELEDAGYNSTTAAAALGAYLGGTPLTTDQYQIVQTALGLAGNPPTSVGAPQLASSSSNTSSSSSSSSSSTSPFNAGSVIGSTLSEANQLLTQNGIATQFVYLTGQSKPLGSAAATVPYQNAQVTGVTLSSPTNAVLTVQP